MRLYIGIQAASVASSENLRQPLSAQGRLDVTHVAGFLSLFEQPAPAIIWHGNRLAAIQTATMVAKVWQSEACETLPLLCDDTATLALLAHVQAQRQDCALIAHPAVLQALLACLLGCPPESLNLAAGSMLCLQHQDAYWQLQWSLRPTLFYRHDEEAV